MPVPPRHPLFHPVVKLPSDYEVYDLTASGRPVEESGSKFAVGRYHEKRPGIYTAPLFGVRDIHVGIDLFAPVGTPVYAFEDGRVFLSGYNAAEGDYGYTLITEHRIGGVSIYALYGHLSARSVEGKEPGRAVRRGEEIGWMGDRQENGGWPSHVHFQLSYEKPQVCDMPGVVSERELPLALLKYPDPRLVLGALY